MEPSTDPLEELKRRRDLMKNTAMPAIMEDEPFAIQRPTAGIGPRRGMGQLAPVVTTAKAPTTFERATAAMRPFGNPEGEGALTDEQRKQLERAQTFVGYGEDVAAQVVGQPKRTFYRAATGLSKFINPKGTAELSGIMREAEESTKPKTGLGKGVRIASEIGQYLPFGLVGGSALAGLESAASSDASLANKLSNSLGAGDIRDSRVRAALDAALIPLIGKTVGVAAPYVGEAIGKTVGGARNLAKTLDFGEGMTRGISEGAREAADVATPNLRGYGPTPAQTQRAAEARAAYDKGLADEARSIVLDLGYKIDDATPGAVRRRPVSDMASDADVKKYLADRDEGAAWKAIRDEATTGKERKAIDAEIKTLLTARKQAGASAPVKTGQAPASPALSAEAQASYEAYLANLPPEAAASTGSTISSRLQNAITEAAATVAKKPRGRPPKAPPTPEELAAAAALPPKKRGRPRKVPAEQPALDIPEGTAAAEGVRPRSGAISPRLTTTLGGAVAGGAGGALTAEPGDPQSALTRGILGAIAGGAGGAMLGKMLPEAGAASRVSKEIPEIYGTRAIALADEINAASGYTNIARFSEDPRVQDRLLAVTEEMVRTKDVPLRTASGRLREPETLNALRERVAADMGIDVKDVATRTKNGERIGRDDLLRVKTALDMAMDEETALVAKLAKEEYATVGMSAEAITAEKQLLQTNLNRVEADRRALSEVLSSQKMSTGRDLGSLRAMSLRNFDPAAWEAQLQRYAQRPLNQEERIASRAYAADRDVNKLMELAGKVKKSTRTQKLGAYFQTNLLSAPSTQISNIGGGVTGTVLDIAKDAPAALVDRLFSVKTGVRTKDFNPLAIIDASFKGAGTGLKEFGPVMKGKVLPGQSLTDVPRNVNFDTYLLNKYVQITQRFLSATDNVFRRSSLYRANAEQARVIAKAEKLTGEAYAKRVDELTVRPSPEMEVNSIAAADFVTFQSDSKLARLASSAANAYGGAGKLFIPFSRTPANIAVQTGYSYTPLAIVGEAKNISKLLLAERPTSAKERQALSNLQREISEGIGRATVGSAAIKIGYELAKRGRMTGFFPKDQRTRDEWAADRKTEGAVKIFGTWVQVNRLSPLGNLMQIGASMYDEDEAAKATTLLEKGKNIAATATAPFRTVSELPMVSNLKDVIEIADKFGEDEAVDAGARIAARTAGGLLPLSSLTSTVGRVIDPIQRETKGATGLETAGNEMLARNFILKAATDFLGLSNPLPLPEKVDPLGTVMRREGGLLSTIFSPVTRTTSLNEVNPLRGEMARTGAVAGRIKREEGETGQEFAERQKMTGAAIATIMSAVTKTPGYQQINTLPTGTLRQLLEQAGENTANISDERIRARVQGYLLEKAMEQTKTLISEQRAKGKAVPSAAKGIIKSIVR
jgi:hypothetical protein